MLFGRVLSAVFLKVKIERGVVSCLEVVALVSRKFKKGLLKRQPFESPGQLLFLVLSLVGKVMESL